MLRAFPFLALLATALPASAAISSAHRAVMQKSMPRNHVVVQTHEGDLDGDGKPEWIAIGEPEKGSEGAVSVGIFAPPAKGKGPELLFRQSLNEDGLDRASARVIDVPEIGKLVVLVGARENRAGDSLFAVQIYGFVEERYKPLAPEPIRFRSQGGFSIEELDPESPGHEVLVWSYLSEPGELLFDFHHYEARVYRWKGQYFVAQDHPTRLPEKYSDPAKAGAAAGSKVGDWRRQMPRVAEVP